LIKLCIFSGNRAEYGLLSPIIKNLNKSKKIKVFFIVSGSHVDKKFGETINEIKKDKIKIYQTIKLFNSNRNKDQIDYTPKNISEIIEKYSTCLRKIRPNYNLVYADRFESFGATIASSQMNIPTIHIEGGDKTEGGTLDDSVRHAMTKISHLHITTNENAKKRIIKLGEEKWRVQNFGYSAMDYVKLKNYAKKNEIENKLNIKITKPIVLFTQHPIPVENENIKDNFEKILNSIIRLSKHNIQIIITYPNSDYGGKKIIEKINKLKNIKNIKIVRSLGRYLYHGILALNNKSVKVICAGNSSSGIKETAIFKCPVVNIGPRQNGRFRSSNVFDVKYNENQIYEIIFKCIYDERIYRECLKTKNLYGGGNTGKKIKQFIENLKISKTKILIKKITY
jgi:UDP-hydrolysing UDP-N-acetyl-D-glucosamine 2-epimerase|tara:strand:+ start:122 stop:1309 length:1188 start_codon:yes stop_codon:yes gene_type:complete